jgi:hypothetical protein
MPMGQRSSFAKPVRKDTHAGMQRSTDTQEESLLMSRALRHEIAGHVFRTQAMLINYIRDMLAGYATGERLSHDDLRFMCALLARHPNAIQKQGVGVVAMEVRQNPAYPQSRGFWLIRADGSSTDFSYWECLRETPHTERFHRALRVAIEPDIQAYCRAFFAARHGRPYYCPYRGERVELRGSHVDHQAPNTFQALVQRFVAHEGLEIARVQIDGKAEDNVVQDTLADTDLARRWRAFHRSHATLQVVSRTANLSLLKRRGSVMSLAK